MSNRRFKRATTSQNPTISPAAQQNRAIYIYTEARFSLSRRATREVEAYDTSFPAEEVGHQGKSIFPGGGGRGHFPLLSSCSLVVGPGLRFVL